MQAKNSPKHCQQVSWATEMRFLLTRAEEAASRTAERLTSAGHTIINAPLSVIEPLAFDWPVGPFDALIATSGNAFLAIAEPSPFKALPLYTVGERTADIARAAGFIHAMPKGRNADELADFLLNTLPASARFLYLAGEDRRPQLEERLAEAGRYFVLVETYRAIARGTLTEAARAAIGDNAPLTVLHYSPRSARLFLKEAAGLPVTRPGLRHIALSDAVAAPLLTAGCRVRVAGQPDEDALLALAGGDEAEDSGDTTIRAERPWGDTAPMSDNDTTERPPARAESPRSEPPVIDAVVGKPPAPAGPILTAALGGGLVGAALIGVGLWAIGPTNDQSERLTALETAVGGTATRRSVETLDKRVATLETKLPDIEAAARRPLPTPTPAPMPAPMPAPAPIAAANDDGQITRALQDMRNELATLTQRLSTLEKSSADTVAKIPAPEKIDALNRDIAQLGQRIAATEKNVAVNTPGAQDGGGLAVAVALKAKLQDGQPFAKEWAALESLRADASALAILKPLAAQGVPSAAALAVNFAAPARAIAAAPPPRPQGEVAWTDKVSAALSRLVRVTPVDPAKGEDPVSLTVRIQSALAKDDSASALALWQKLPEPARRDTATFGRDLDQRVKAERAVSQIMAGMVDRLGAAKP
jgi:uroporphyrinogen-III synthase